MSDTQLTEPISRLSPQQYNAILQKMTLTGIHVTNVTCDADLSKKTGALNAIFNMASDGFEKRDHVASVFSNATFLGMAADTSVQVIGIKARYSVLLSFDEPVTEEFLEIFSKWNVRLIVWPFFRELVHSMVPRMGLPPLIAPLSFGPEPSGTSD